MATARSRPRADADDGISALVPAVHAVMKGFFRHLHPVLEAEGISLAQFWALHHVSSVGGSSVSDIACHLSVSTPTASAGIDPLVEAGLLTRRRSKTDRRTVELRLTVRGRRTEARVWAAIGTVMDAAAADLSRAEVATAVRVFRALRERLDADTTEAGP